MIRSQRWGRLVWPSAGSDHPSGATVDNTVVVWRKHWRSREVVRSTWYPRNYASDSWAANSDWSLRIIGFNGTSSGHCWTFDKSSSAPTAFPDWLTIGRDTGSSCDWVMRHSLCVIYASFFVTFLAVPCFIFRRHPGSHNSVWGTDIIVDDTQCGDALNNSFWKAW